MIKPFCGTFREDEIVFLLHPVVIPLTPVPEKERLLQSGARHYSEMLSEERPPSRDHLAVFWKAVRRNGRRMALEILRLAFSIASRHAPDEPLILASLVRAGCPVGVLLSKALKLIGQNNIKHYGVSIIRDRGLDGAAWQIISSQAPPENIYFVDGWTGKGAICHELAKSLGSTPHTLVVLTDMCGGAQLCASSDDWLIPSGILGAPINGLISRSLWAENGLHGCMLWDSLAPWDVTREFIDHIVSLWTREMLAEAAASRKWPQETNNKIRKIETDQVIKKIMRLYGVEERNHIKPGIAEATRAILRRVPDCVLVSDSSDPDLELLVGLSREKNVKVHEAGKSIWPYKAMTIIKSLKRP